MDLDGFLASGFARLAHLQKKMFQGTDFIKNCKFRVHADLFNKMTPDFDRSRNDLQESDLLKTKIESRTYTVRKDKNVSASGTRCCLIDPASRNVEG